MEWSDLINSQPPRSVMGFLKQSGRGINRYGMIKHGDRVLLSISGGKDSLALALALRMRLRFVPITYHLEALLINWREHPHSAAALGEMHRFFGDLEIPFAVVDADMKPESFGGRFDCYRCGRNRRRILFDHVKGWDGVPLIATGHHLDDLVQTTLMNMVLQGTFATMNPVQEFFGGDVRVIRPLCEVREESIRSVARACRLPVSTIDCPFRTKNIRIKVAPVVEQLNRINPRAREHIFESLHNINHEYLPGAIASCCPTPNDIHSEIP